MGAAFTFNKITSGPAENSILKSLNIRQNIETYVKVADTSILFSTLPSCPSCQLRKPLHLFIHLHASLVNTLLQLLKQRTRFAELQIKQTQLCNTLSCIQIPISNVTSLGGGPINIIALFGSIFYFTTPSRCLFLLISQSLAFPQKFIHLNQRPKCFTKEGE